MNCKIELDLSWARISIIYEIPRIAVLDGNNPAEATLTTGAKFQIHRAKC